MPISADGLYVSPDGDADAVGAVAPCAGAAEAAVAGSVTSGGGDRHCSPPATARMPLTHAVTMSCHVKPRVSRSPGRLVAVLLLPAGGVLLVVGTAGDIVDLDSRGCRCYIIHMVLKYTLPVKT